MIPSAYGRFWGSLMGKPLPMELRQRVVDFVEEGHTHRAAAAQFRVSVKFVNDMVLLKRRTGSLEAKRQGNGGGHGKLAGVAGWTLRRIKEKRDLTLDELDRNPELSRRRTMRVTFLNEINDALAKLHRKWLTRQ